MRLILLDVNNQFFAERFIRHGRARFLDLDHGLDLRNQKVTPQRAASIGRRPFLRADIIKIQRQQRAQQVLHIVFIRYAQGFTTVMPVRELSCNLAEAGKDALYWFKILHFIGLQIIFNIRGILLFHFLKIIVKLAFYYH